MRTTVPASTRDTARRPSLSSLAVLALALALLIIGAQHYDRPNRLQHSPLPADCEQTMTVGHVPGHLDPVWELTCAPTTTPSPTGP